MRGQLLNGRYRIGERLGAGGMGVVWEAHDDRLHRTVAVKVLRDGLGSADAVARLTREARAAAGLSENRHVVTVHDVGRDGDTVYVVMERVRGRTLDKVLGESSAPPPPVRAVEWAGQVCAGLAAAHEAGVVHRDIKPANVILTDDLSVKVLDFGIAWFDPALGLDRLTEGVLMGTAPWMSPEQIRSGPVDHRSDLYAVGCLLYELLTGQPPFGSRSREAHFDGHLYETPAAPSTLRPGLPAALDALTLQLLAKDPADRPQRAADVAARLGDIATGLRPAAPPPDAAAAAATRAAAAPNASPRTVRLVAAAVAVVLLAGGLVTALVWANGRGGTPPGAGASDRAGASRTASPGTTPPARAGGAGPSPSVEASPVAGARFPRAAKASGPLPPGWREVREAELRFTVAVPADYERSRERAGVLYTGPGGQIVVSVYHEFGVGKPVDDDMRDQLGWYRAGADGTVDEVRGDGPAPADVLGVPGWTIEADYHKTDSGDPGSRHRRVELAATDAAREQVYFRVEFPDVPEQERRARSVLATMLERIALQGR
ncbi:serine/threonine-protein kinase [Streptomyces zhihengii]|uniref:non-specific serine/threonine protein kinase n=1 Tax=Streptomyces zhihengii TaxID=1818004 RepID=A0ABS2V3H1_9ACTN|nr:serine/threonine-protein kinase [Streptomyces zhihengii]MBM9624364.1 serine/threonine protein kinase [Streptomyces zhihengii]